MMTPIAAVGFYVLRKWDLIDWSLIAFTAFAALSISWSPDTQEGLSSLRYILIFAGIFFLVRHTQVTVGVPALISVAGVYLLLALWPDMIGGFGNENWVVEFLIVATILSFLASKKVGLLAGLALVLYVVFWNTSWVELSAAWAAIAVFAICWRKWYLTPLVLAPLTLIWFPYRMIAGSFITRAEIWTNSFLIWLDNPFTGTGLGGFNYTYPSYQEAHLDIIPETGLFLNQANFYVGQTHNEVLQVLAELGVGGFLLAGVFAFLVCRLAFKRRKTAKVQFWALVALGGMSMVAFPLQNPGTVLLAAVCLGLAARGAPTTRVPLPARGALLASALALLAAAYPYARAQASFELGSRCLTARAYVCAFKEHVGAVNIFDYPARYRRQLSLTLHALQASKVELNLHPEAADRVNEIALSAGPMPATHIARLNYLALTGRNPEEMVDLLNHLLTNHPNLNEVKALKETLE